MTKYLLSLLSLLSSAIFIWFIISYDNDAELTQDHQLTKSIEKGKLLYSDFCVTCHLPSGKGVENIYPPLANSDYLKNNRFESIKSIKYGQQGLIIVNGQSYDGFMTPMGLSDNEVADIMNYINHSWGNDFGKMVTTDEVAQVRE